MSTLLLSKDGGYDFMKHLKKYISFVLVTLCLTTQVFAAVDDGVFPPCEPYTPNAGSIHLSKTSVNFNFSWDNPDYISYFHDGSYWEAEIRSATERSGPKLEECYPEVEDFYSNLPNAYQECDPDDISLGCGNAFYIEEGQPYYGTLVTQAGPEYDSDFEIYFESEVGDFFVIDGYPEYYQAYSTHLFTLSRNNVAWIK